MWRRKVSAWMGSGIVVARTLTKSAGDRWGLVFLVVAIMNLAIGPMARVNCCSQEIVKSSSMAGIAVGSMPRPLAFWGDVGDGSAMASGDDSKSS